MIDKARYYLALMMLAAIPPAILFWFSIQPFSRYGAEYDAYCSRVPRFIPKIGA
jgi:protein-S-isoprenylcysteine O-methyltransferase Ste14